MTFSALPVDQRPYRRFAALSPSDTTVYDPAPDAIMIPVIGGTTSFSIVGSDDVMVVFNVGQLQSAAIFPMSVKKVLSASQATPIGLWRD